jgi:hypothetical protein
VFLAAVDLVDLRRHTVSLLRLRPSSVLRSVELRPQGRLETHMVGQVRASALPWRFFPLVRRQLQHRVPPLIRPYPLSPKKCFADAAPAPLSGEDMREFTREKHIGRPEREISMLVYGNFDFQNPPHMASQHLMIPRIAAAGTWFSHLPSQA